MSIVFQSVKYADLTFNASDLSKTTEHLIGNKGQKIRATIDFTLFAESRSGPNDVANDFDQRFEYQNSDLTAGGFSTIKRIDGGSFLSEGLIPGDRIRVFSTTASLNNEAEVFSMTDDVIVFDGIIPAGVTGFYEDMILTAIDRYTAVEVKHVLQENELEEQMESIVDGTIFTLAGETGVGTFPLSPKGKESGGYQLREGLATITGVDSCVGFVPAGCINYQIIYEFYIGPFYEDSRAQCEGIFPQYAELEKCLTSIFEITLLKNANNLNGSRTAFTPAKIGNTGFENENYNQGENPFSIESVQYKELNGNKEYSGILLDKVTEVNITLKSNGEFVTGLATTLFQPGFCLLLDDRTKYQELDTPYSDNVYFEYTTQSAPATTGPESRIGSHWNVYGEGFSFVRAEYIDADTVILQLNFEPGPRLRNKLLTDEENKYSLWVNVGRDNKAPEDSNTVALTLPCNNLINSSNIENALIVEPPRFFEHDQLITGDWTPTYNGYIQDDIIAQTFIGLTGELPEITNIKVEIILKTSSRGGGFTAPLETWEVPTDGVPFNEIKKTENRNYVLRSTDNHLERFVQRDPSKDIFDEEGVPIIRYLELRYAFRFRWEDWVANANVPASVFEDVNEPNNGLNERWNRYSLAQNFLSGEAKLFYRVTVDVKLGDDTDQDIKETWIRAGDYNEQMDSEFTWPSPVVKTFDPTATEITPDVLGDDFTTVESTFVSATPHGGVANWYGEVKGDKEQGGVNQIFEISSVKPLLPNGALIPEDGQNLLSISEVDANTIKTVCRIDPSKVTGSKFIVTPRIGRIQKEVGFSFFTALDAQTFFQFTDTVTMEMGDGTTVSGSLIQHTYTDSREKWVLATELDPSLHTDIDMGSNVLTKWIDLRIFSSLTALALNVNTDLEEIFFPEGNEWDGAINVSNCNLGVIDLSKGLCAETANTTLNASFNFNLTLIIPPLNSGTRRFGSMILNDCDLNYFDIDQANYTTGFSFNIRNNQLTAEEVDMFLKDFADSGTILLNITIDGNNEPPTSEGLASKAIIEGNSGTVIVST